MTAKLDGNPLIAVFLTVLVLLTAITMVTVSLTQFHTATAPLDGLIQPVLHLLALALLPVQDMEAAMLDHRLQSALVAPIILALIAAFYVSTAHLLAYMDRAITALECVYAIKAGLALPVLLPIALVRLTVITMVFALRILV